MKGSKDYTLGIILILIGILFLFLNINIFSSNIIFIILGISFLIGYYKKNNMTYLIIGLLILAGGIGSLANQYFKFGDLSGLITLSCVGGVFLLGYFMKGIKGFIYPGCILPAIGIHSFIESLVIGDLGWLFFLLIALSFLTIYILERKKWQLIVTCVISAFSLFIYLVTTGIFTTKGLRIISYIWPILLVLIGIKLIYNEKRK